MPTSDLSGTRQTLLRSCSLYNARTSQLAASVLVLIRPLLMVGCRHGHLAGKRQPLLRSCSLYNARDKPASVLVLMWLLCMDCRRAHVRPEDRGQGTASAHADV